MNKFRMAKAGIEVNKGLERLYGDSALYEELLIKFLDDTNYQEMMKAIEAGDTKSAFSFAHSLKGVSGNLSMAKLYQAVYPAVEELRNGNGDVGAYLPAITEAYEKVVAAIEDMKG